jgi:rubrerythrin
VNLKESLHCEVCSSVWVRKKARGRKPKVCPQCIKDEVVLVEETSYMSEKSTSKRTAKKWVCPQCNASVTLFVNLQYPPVCRNPQAHSTRSIEMQINGRKAQVA